MKKDSNGKVVKHKARLVAKGYVQRQDIDFEEVFAPIERLDTVRVIIALVANQSWEVHHLDVKPMFLNGELEEEVYVTQLEGFKVPNQKQKVYRLSKALYGWRKLHELGLFDLIGVSKSLALENALKSKQFTQ